MTHKNGTPFSDEAWKKWYSHKSNKEAWIEEYEAQLNADIDQAIEDRGHQHEGSVR